MDERKDLVEKNKPLPATTIDEAAFQDYRNGDAPNFSADYSNQSKIESYMFQYVFSFFFF
jgi:hypothetical protein